MLASAISLFLFLGIMITPSFRHYSTQEGLSQVTVNCMAQDTDGRIWIGTGDGLNCMNGHSCKIFRHIEGDPYSLRDDEVLYLYTDSTGEIWVITASGASIFSPSSGKYRDFDAVPGTITCCLDLRNASGDSVLFAGRMLICTDNRFVSYDPDSGECETQWVAPGTISSVVTSGGGIWLCVPEDGLYKWDKDGLQKIYSGILNSRKLCPAPEGSIWAGVGNRIVKFDTQGRIAGQWGIENGLSSPAITAMEYDQVGNLWIGTTNNLSILAPDGSISVAKHSKDVPESISGSLINCLFRDSSGGMWVGTHYNGVDYHHPSFYFPGWISLQTKIPDSDDVIRALSFDRNNKLWISSRSGMFLYNISSRQIEYEIRHILNREGDWGIVNAICFDENGCALLGTSRSGIFVMDEKYRIRRIPADIKLSLSIEHIKENEYIVAASNGVFVYDEAINTAYRLTDPNEAGGDTFYAKADSMTLWVGYKNHLSKYHMQRKRDGRLHAVEYARYGDIPMVQSILFSGGKKWFASTKGLFCLNSADSLERRFGAREGWPTNQMRGLEEDRFGRIWISTENGIVRYDPVSGDTRTWGLREGLKSAKFNPFVHCTGPDDRVYFGSNAGVCSISTNQKSEVEWAPVPMVTDILVNGEPVDATVAKLTLKHYHRNIDILMDVPDFISSDNAAIEYKCYGVDQNWRKADNSRKATYTSLPKGKHDFIVRYCNDSGVYSSEKSVLTLLVRPAWYNTLAFQIILIALLVFGVVYVFIREKRIYDSTILSVRNEAKEDITKVRAGSIASHPLTQKENEFLVSVLAVIEKNLSNELFGVQELARELGMSRSNLSIRLKQVTNLPPLNIIRNMRMEKACALLSTKEHSISDVAKQSGFNSSTYFATFFKRQTGMSPTEWMNIR